MFIRIIVLLQQKSEPYYVNEQRIVFDSNYRIVNDEYITDGKNVNYLRGEGIAVFNGPTTVTNKRIRPITFIQNRGVI